MRAGDLHERVIIQQQSAAATQARLITWSTVATVWANITPTRASEQIQAAALGAHHEYRVTIRYRADVTPKMRLSWTPYGFSAAKSLQIHGVQPLNGDRAFLVLVCGEVI